MDKGICSEDGCERGACSRGLCNAHYLQAHKVHRAEWATEREVARLARVAAKVARGVANCMVGDCDGAVEARGMCSSHYRSELTAQRDEWETARTAGREPCRAGDCSAAPNSVGYCAEHNRERSRELYGECSEPECQLAARTSRGLCETHYRVARRVHHAKWAAERVSAKAEIVARNRATSKKPACVIDGCEDVSVGRGICSLHYKRGKREANETWGDRYEKKECAAAGCDAVGRFLRGFCAHHRRVIAYSEIARKRAREHYERHCNDPEWIAKAAARNAAYAHLRRGLERESICRHGRGCINTEIIEGIRERRCHYCPAQAHHADHYIPLSRGGLHCRRNLLPACAFCNWSKGASMPTGWPAALLNGYGLRKRAA